ncbi:MAG: PKD domain-containing protein [Pseudomonadota bacterium]
MSRFKSVSMAIGTLCLCICTMVLACGGIAFADTTTFQLRQGLNGISLPFDNTGLTNAEELCQAVPNCAAAYYWDARAQKFVEHQRNSSENIFTLVPGHPYFVDVTQDTSWTVNGVLPETVTFDLITTDTTNVNLIALPANMTHISTAEDLASSFPNIDTVWYWDEERQGFVGHPKGTDINNFQLVPGHAYFVNVTADTILTIDVALRATLSATPVKGSVPLDVQFSATAAGGVLPYTHAWDIDGDGATDDTRPKFNHIYTECGFYGVTLKVTDGAGRIITDTVAISALSAPDVVASALPATGQLPLHVILSAVVNDDGDIVLYEWDFDGDGSYDYSDPNTATVSHVYDVAGSYYATIRVTDNDELRSTDTVEIVVGNPPTASASTNPIKGPLPLSVTFTGSGIDSDGDIIKYEWDFDGDGIYDWNSDTTGNTTHLYDSSGIFSATLRVTDNNGLTGTDSVLVSVAGPPIAKPRAYPTKGAVPLTVTFFSDGEDPDGTPQYFDWDFNGDGVYDQHLGASMNATYTYKVEGTYTATLKVTDNEGLTSTASITIQAELIEEQIHVAAVAQPSSGGVPLRVSLACDGAGPGIAKYEWDFEGDGTYDWEEMNMSGAPMGLLIDVGYDSCPAFADIDNDGDLDLFVGENGGRIYHYRNEGSGTDPVWSLVGPVKDVNGGTIDNLSDSKPAFSDVDGDGDLDMGVGSSLGYVYYYRNDGSCSEPLWAYVGKLRNTANVVIDVGAKSAPAFADINNDSFLDLFIGAGDGKVYHYAKGNNDLWIPMGAVIDSSGNTIKIPTSNSTVSFVDMDADGDLDMALGDDGGSIDYYRNAGSAGDPVWENPSEPLKDTSGTAIIVSHAAPAFADIEGDGDPDLFAGCYEGRLVFYRNTGNPNEPVWAFVSKTYDHVGVENDSVPAFTDDDSDGDLDMYIGSNDGQICRFSNERILPYPVFSPDKPVADSTGTIIDVGAYSCPAFGDVNDDGKTDMLIGSKSGYLYYYRNDSGGMSAVWTPTGSLIDSKGGAIYFPYLCPALADIDNDGRLELFITGDDPEIRMYRNTGVSEPIWTYVGLLYDENGDRMDPGGPGITYGDVNSLSFADIDNDGDPDLFMSGHGGTITHYENTGTPIAPKWRYVTSTYQSISLTGESKPCFMDIDFDGDYDLFVGDNFGRIYFYPGLGQVIHTYASPGIYHPTMRVTDQNGEVFISSETVTALDPGSPTCRMAASPVTGSPPLTVSFYGTASDPDGAIVAYEWDFDGDGSYDYTSPTGQASHVYERSGLYTATLRVTDDTGKTATDCTTIRVYVVILSATRTEVFNPDLGQSATITSVISDDTVATLRIADHNGSTVRILTKDRSRAAGIAYLDTWDGRDDSGKLVLDGVYYYLIDYEDCGQNKTYDLRETAQYQERSPGRDWPASFDPYKDEKAEVSYTLTKPCEVSMYLWRRDYSSGAEQGIARVRTLLVRQPRGTGLQREFWDGADDKGVIVDHWGTGGYPVTLWAFTLANNAIIVTGSAKPEISAVNAEPNYFSPVYDPYSDAPRYTIVSFALSKPATVDIQVVNHNGIVIQKIRKTNLPAGTNAVVWNGVDFSGNLVKAGNYTISLVAIDDNEERSLPHYAAISLYY